MSPEQTLTMLIARTSALFPGWVHVAGSLNVAPDTLLPDERPAIARALLHRQREFAGGRAAARNALRRLTGATHSVPMDGGRAPVWPRGTTGSITHSGGYCLAAVARRAVTVSLGLDLEIDQPLPPEILNEVVLPDEDRRESRLIFSAKETVFKALHPVAGSLFGFDAIKITVLDQGFTAETRVPLGTLRAGTAVHGGSWRGMGWIVTALAFQPFDR